MAKAKKTTPPAVTVTEATPWGDISEEETPEAYRDATFVKGYSDKRIAFELAQRRGEPGTPLPFRLQYVPVEARSGQPDNTKVSYYKTRGYVPVQYDQLATLGINADESGFIRGTDGTCRLGSQMLMMAPAEKAARHAKRVAEDTKALSGQPLAQLERAAEQFTQHRAGTTGGRADVWQEEEVVRE